MRSAPCISTGGGTDERPQLLARSGPLGHGQYVQQVEEHLSSPATSFVEAYGRMVDSGLWEADAAQEKAVGLLNDLLRDLRSSSARPPKGVYLFGPVGRGKSQLLNLFMAHARHVKARRTHMHTFMSGLHKRLHEIKSGDPIQQTARELADEIGLLGFDEFYITNIADAILLGRYFEHLFKYGVVVVATSNWPMEELYQNGRNRQRFLPFLRVLQQNLRAQDLGDGRDYRQASDPAWPLWVLSTRADANRTALEALFERYATREGTVPEPEAPPKAAGANTVWYGFRELCDQPVSRRQYMDIVRNADTVVVEDVPYFQGEADADSALRFVMLIDLCYEHRRRVIVSAPDYPGELYPAGPVLEAFRRTASRLAEMQTWVNDPIPPAL